MSRDMSVLCITCGTSFAALTMTRPLVPLFATQLGAGPFLVGVVVAAFAALPFLLAVPAGALTDRLGPRSMIVSGSLGIALAALWVGEWPSLTVLVLSQVLMGISQLAVVVASQTFAGSAKPGVDRERAFGWFGTSASLGQLIGPLIGGFTADQTSYASAFLISGCFGLMTPAIALALPSAERASPRASGGLGSTLEVRRLLRHGGVKTGMLSSFSVLFALGVRQTFFPLYVQSLGYSATVVGGLLSCRAMASVIVRPAMSWIISACRGRFPVLVGSLFLLGAGVFITPFTQSLALLALASVAIGVGIGLCQPISMLAVADSASRDVRGLAMGVRMTGNRLAQLVNPIIFGGIAAALGLGVAFSVAGLILFSTAAFLFRWRDQLDKAPAKPPSVSTPAR